VREVGAGEVVVLEREGIDAYAAAAAAVPERMPVQKRRRSVGR